MKRHHEDDVDETRLDDLPPCQSLLGGNIPPGAPKSADRNLKRVRYTSGNEDSNSNGQVLPPIKTEAPGIERGHRLLDNHVDHVDHVDHANRLRGDSHARAVRNEDHIPFYGGYHPEAQDTARAIDELAPKGLEKLLQSCSHSDKHRNAGAFHNPNRRRDVKDVAISGCTHLEQEIAIRISWLY